MQINLTQTWYPIQKQIFDSPHRFIVVAAGRRGGKTYGAIQWLVREALRSKKDAMNWWISGSYRQANIALRYFFMLYPKHKYPIVKKYFKAEHRIVLINDAIIEFKTSEKPENLEGESLQNVVLDECGIILRDERLYYQTLRPMLSDSLGRMVAIGTPKNCDLFKKFFGWGKNPDMPDWISFHFPSYVGGLSKYPEEIAALKRMLPSHIYNQEIEAQFITDGSVFRNVDEVVNGVEENIDTTNYYVAGIDLAKYRDYTVISIGYKNKCVYIEKLPHSDFSLQIERIRQITKEWNLSEIFVDRTGIGDPVVEAMQELELPIEPIYFDYHTKINVLNNLILLFERRAVQVVYNKELINELKSFEFSLTSKGLIKMDGKDGSDHVTSIALLFWGLRNRLEGALVEAFGKRDSQDFPGIAASNKLRRYFTK
mgnify:CR=1 FL=1